MSEEFKAQLAKATGKSQESETSTAKFRVKAKEKKKDVSSTVKDNPFYQIAMSTQDPQAQKEAMRELMVYVDAETTAKNSKYLEEYSAFMQAERQRLATELIEMTDTKTFSNMQKVLKDINDGVLDFEEQIKPFMEIINAVREIQAEDATTDILAEMREDSKNKQAMEEAIRKLDKEANSFVSAIQAKLAEIEKKKEDRSFFGFGDVKQSAKDAIAELQTGIAELKGKQQSISQQKETVRSEYKTVASKFDHLKKSKDIMANMLNLSEAEHESRHQQLVNTAANFVTTTQERVTETLERSEQMSTQIKNLSDLAFTMRGRYSVLSEAAKDAEKINSSMHEELKASLETIDDPLEKMNKEGISRDMSKHITMLNDATNETTEVISDLTVSSQRIETMEAANKAQISKTKQIQTTGIAGVADNLSSVLTAINQAAIGQASTAAAQSLRRMNETTIGLTKEQMLNMAKSKNDDNTALVKMLEQLSGFGEVIELANQSTRESLNENRNLVDTLHRTADEVQRSAQDTLEITSDQITSEIKEDE